MFCLDVDCTTTKARIEGFLKHKLATLRSATPLIHSFGFSQRKVAKIKLKLCLIQKWTWHRCLHNAYYMVHAYVYVSTSIKVVIGYLLRKEFIYGWYTNVLHYAPKWKIISMTLYFIYTFLIQNGHKIWILELWLEIWF